MKLKDVTLQEIKGIWGDELQDGEKGTPVIKTNNLTYEGHVDLSHITFRNIPASKVTNCLLRYGDLLIEKSGGTKTHSVGYVNIFEDKNDEYVANNFIFVLRPNSKLIDSKYLFYQLKYRYESGQIEHLHNQTTGIQNLKVQSYLNQEIKYVSIQTQQKISNKLDKIEKAIKLEKSVLNSLDALIKSRFNELFGDVDSNTNGYPSHKIGSQFSLGAGGTPSTQNKEYWDNGTISWIGSNMCQNVVLYENDGKFITEKGYANSSAKLFKPDTVLIALVGATIGKVALLKFETTTNQNVLGMWDIKKNGYDPYYVYYYMQAIYGKFTAIGDGNFKMASKAFVSNLDILKPSLALQTEFSMFVEKIDKLKFSI